MTATTHVRLSYVSYKTEFEATDRAVLFGKLVELASGVVKLWSSDLYHDAMWLSEHMVGHGVVFYFGVRETGTSLDKSEANVSAFNDSVYRVTARVVNGMSTAQIEKVFSR